MSFSAEELLEFKQEGLELLEKAEKCLLSIDNGADYQSNFDSVFRSLHNLKGAAGMMEQMDIHNYIHDIETLLMEFNEKKEIPKVYISLFLKGIDSARGSFNGEKESFPFKEEVEKIKSATVLKVNEVNISDEVLIDFVNENDEICLSISESLRSIERNQFSVDVIDKLSRDIHTLKGSCYLFGFNHMGALAHALENILEPMRETKTIPSKALINEIYNVLRVIENANASIKNNSNDSMVAEAAQHIIKKLETMNNSDEIFNKPNNQQPQEKQEASETLLKEGDSTGSIRVSVQLLDSLMTLMGEMVLVRNQVLQYSNQSEDLEFLNLSQRLNAVTSEIQEQMMKTRMQPIGNILNKFHRLVRDISNELDKSIQLQIFGAETELDKSLLEAIKDPLTHIIRNACDHGIEKSSLREAAGKLSTGSIHIKSYHEGGQIVIEVKDDGQGIKKDSVLKKAIEKGLINESQAVSMNEKDIIQLIFSPGFSTAEAVTNLSGRGVGMDVVKTNIERIGGTVEISSKENLGSSIKLKIPLTLAIVPALIVETSGSTFAIPQVKLIELVRVDASSEEKIEFVQNTPVYRLRGEILPLVDLGQSLELHKSDKNENFATNIAVLSAENFSFGLMVDSIKDTADIVVKPINRLLKSLNAYSGATILGDGSVALILDVQGIAKITNLSAVNSVSTKDDKKDIDNKSGLSTNEDQDFLVVNLNSPTSHAILLNYVHRLEEFKNSEIELSGHQRVIRYRDSILPIISANKELGYDETGHTADLVQVIVVKRSGQLFGIEVNSIVDTLTTQVSLEKCLNKRAGILGNLNCKEKLFVVIDPIELILNCFPELNTQKIESSVLQKTPYKNSLLSQKILFVEDTAFFRKHVKKLLEENGHDVVCACDGEDALQVLKSTSVDLIISDIEMPKMNGFDFAKAIKKDAKYKHIPMLALSSRFDQSYRQRGAEVGFSNYLEKINSEALLFAVNELSQNLEKTA